MKHVHDKATKVAAELMAAIIRVNGCGKSMQDIDEVSKLYLRLESNIAEVLLSPQRAVSCHWRLFILLPSLPSCDKLDWEGGEKLNTNALERQLNAAIETFKNEVEKLLLKSESPEAKIADATTKALSDFS